MWKTFVEALNRLDSWVNSRQVRWPRLLRTNPQDLSLAGRSIVRLFQLIFVLGILGVVFWSFYWLAYRGSQPDLANPQNQNLLPTVEPSPTIVVNTDPWQLETWLSPSDAMALRQQPNVVNLAYLDGGGAKYSADHSLILIENEPWTKNEPLGMSEMSVLGTAILFKLNGQMYSLNTYQPFTVKSNPEFVYIVDARGTMWRASVSQVELKSLDKVIRALLITINPNTNLTLTY